MKTIIFFLSLWTLVLGSSLIVYSAAAEEIVSIATLEYHPWTGRNLKFNGFVNQVITEAFRRKGYTVKFTYLPWKRGLIETKNGDYSALSYVYFSQDREKEFKLSDPISEEKIVFFHLKTNPMKDWKSLEDLRYYKIGATRGYTYTKAFWDLANTKRLRVDVSDSDVQNFKKLFNGRIGLFPSGLVNGYNLLQKEFEVSKSHLLSYHPKPLTKTTGHLAFTRSRQESENLVRIFNQGLAELKNEGLYDRFVINLIEGKYTP